MSDLLKMDWFRGIAIGVAIGIGVGVALDNYPVGLVLGFGVAMAFLLRSAMVSS